MNAKELEEIKKYIDKNLARGFIWPSFAKYRSLVLFVLKKERELQLVVDYRVLNQTTIKDRYSIPLISDLQDRLEGARYFTLIDLKEVYYLIWIKKGHKWKTTFRTQYSQFEYLVLLISLTNTLATF